jgi:hypothetical protein
MSVCSICESESASTKGVWTVDSYFFPLCEPCFHPARTQVDFDHLAWICFAVGGRALEVGPFDAPASSYSLNPERRAIVVRASPPWAKQGAPTPGKYHERKC